MRSIAFDERKKSETHALDLAEAMDGEDGSLVSEVKERDIVDGIVDDETDTRRINELRQLVANNENAALVMEGLLDGMKPADIRDALNLTSTEYDSARTYISRRLNAHFGRPKT